MKLIIFFNGWGMNSDIFNHFPIEKKITIIFINYPYSTKSIQKINTSLFDEVFILGWSFGAYYANVFLKEYPAFQKYVTIAINGSPELIGKYGISEKVFNLTKDSLSLESLAKFDCKMLAPPNFRRSTPCIEKLKEELIFLKTQYKVVDNHFKYALISKNDKIIPFKNQILYFEQEKIKIKIIESGHYIFNCFFGFNNIIALLDYEV